LILLIDEEIKLQVRCSGDLQIYVNSYIMKIGQLAQ